MTNREFYNAIVKANLGEDITNHALAEIGKLDAKNTKRKETETKEQKENKVLMGTILANLSAGTPTVASTLGTILGVSTQKASALCTLLVKEGKAVVTDVKVKGKGTVKGYLLPSPITDEEVAE
jgi:hypothetical protein